MRGFADLDHLDSTDLAAPPYPRIAQTVASSPSVPYLSFTHTPNQPPNQVMGQLTEIGESDVFEELDLLESTDLSNVEYMPAYLNKRLNNRLWSRRKAHNGGYA